MNNSTILSCYPVLIPVVKRKPILLVDESHDSTKAIDVFKRSGIEYVEYDIRRFKESCVMTWTVHPVLCVMTYSSNKSTSSIGFHACSSQEAERHRCQLQFLYMLRVLKYILSEERL
jgi:hypothetical protein